MTGTVEIGRLKMRVEGEQWVATYELERGKVAQIGSIAMRLVCDGTPRARERRHQFLQLASDCCADIIESATGIRPTMGVPQAAPEHERSGRA